MKLRQDAMKSKQVPLILVGLCAVMLMTQCALLPEPPGAPPLATPFDARTVVAVAPLRNESGSTHPDVLAISDQLSNHLANAHRTQSIPVNRVLQAMEALQMSAVQSATDARVLMRTLDADALIVGSITAWDPYDPPKVGMILELFTLGRSAHPGTTDLDRVTEAATDEMARIDALKQGKTRAIVNGYYNAADPAVRQMLRRYAHQRGSDPKSQPFGEVTFHFQDEEPWRQYRLSMDLYSEFVTYVMSWRLLRDHESVIQQASVSEKPHR